MTPDISLSQRGWFWLPREKATPTPRGQAREASSMEAQSPKSLSQTAFPSSWLPMGPPFWRLEREGKEGQQIKAPLHSEFIFSPSPFQISIVPSASVLKVLETLLWKRMGWEDKPNLSSRGARLLCSHGYWGWGVQDLPTTSKSDFSLFST